MVAGTVVLVVRDAEGADAQHLLVERAIGRSLERGVPRWVGVEVVGADKMRRRGDGGDIGVLRGGATVALELRLGPLAKLVGKERSLRAKRDVPGVSAARR